VCSVDSIPDLVKEANAEIAQRVAFDDIIKADLSLGITAKGIYSPLSDRMRHKRILQFSQKY